MSAAKEKKSRSALTAEAKAAAAAMPSMTIPAQCQRLGEKLPKGMSNFIVTQDNDTVMFMIMNRSKDRGKLRQLSITMTPEITAQVVPDIHVAINGAIKHQLKVFDAKKKHAEEIIKAAVKPAPAPAPQAAETPAAAVIVEETVKAEKAP